MNSVIEYIRFAADQALAVPNLLDLRPYTVTLITNNWSGERPGIGAKMQTETIVSNDGYVNPRFRQVSKEDIVLSGGALKDQDVIIGPFVFPYNIGTASGGLDPMIFSPNVSEFYINITGPNFPVLGVNYKKIYDDSQKNVMYRVFLRAVATQNV